MNKQAFSLALQFDLELISKELPSKRMLELAVVAPLAGTEFNRPGLNLALVLDRSGSMKGEKLAYVKQAAEHVINLLEEKDKVALVAYDDEVLSLSPSVAVSKEIRDELKLLLRSIRCGSLTNLSGGWLQGCQFVATAIEKGQVNRALLLTDGLANEGITDMEELGMHARQLHKRGVSTSTFGVGEGYNEHLLEFMANQGGGNFYYIASPRQIPEIFTRELDELAAITARSIEVEVNLPPHVDAHLFAGWKQEWEGRRLRIFLGDLASGQRREVYLRLLTPPQDGASTLEIDVTARARGENDSLFESKATLALRYTEKEEIRSATPNREMLSRACEVEVADNANQALILERQGEREKARRLLIESINEAAPNLSPQKAAEYQKMADEIQDGLNEQQRKASHHAGYITRQRRR